MRALKAFLLGMLAFGILGYALAAAVAVAAQAGGSTIDVSAGPLLLVSVAVEGRSAVTTFGPGLLLIAIVGGLANVGAAQLIRRRTVGRDDRVD